MAYCVCVIISLTESAAAAHNYTKRMAALVDANLHG